MKFRTDGMRGKSSDFNLQGIKSMGRYVGMSSKIRPILVGRDTRITGEEFKKVFTQGVTSSGQKVLDVGILPTPAISYLTKEFGCGYGVMVTASHNPSEYNGFKFFDLNGKKIPKCVQSGLEVAYDSLDDFENVESGNTGFGENYFKEGKVLYLEHILNSVDEKFDGLRKKIVVDSANGATSLVAKELFSRLGFNPIMYNTEIMGGNINNNCGSSYPEFISRKVREDGAYCGIAFDGDGDRVIFCDEKGNFIDGDQILSYLALDFKFRDGLDKLVLTDYSNFAVDDFLARYGIDVLRVENGDINVMNEMRNSGIGLGGEKSGHVVIGNEVGSGDGMMCGVQLLSRIDLGVPISEQLNLVKMNPQELYNIPLVQSLNGDGIGVEDLAESLTDKYGLDRVFVRESGTEPLLRVLVEGEESKYFPKVLEEINSYLSK